MDQDRDDLDLLPPTPAQLPEARARVIERPPRTTLVALSGGIDSLYVLVKLLRETNDEVLAHHVDFINMEGRFRVERDRCRAIVDYCRDRYRDFSYSESAIDHRGFKFYGYDMIAVGFEAGIVAHSYFLTKQRPVDRWTIGDCVEEAGWSDRWAHVEACFAANCFPNPVPRFFHIPVVTKGEEIAYLPDDLLALAWTCRTPVKAGQDYRECGGCKTCKLMIEITGAPSAAAAVA